MLQRNQNTAIIGGVAAGLAEEHNVSIWLVRTGFVFTFFLFGAGLLAYVYLWVNYPDKNNQMRLTFN